MIHAIVQPVKLASTHSAFALHAAGGAALTWGDPDYGGDSSQVQKQLARVQQIQATERAFASILDDGCVVTWGDVGFGADSTQVQEHLINVAQIQANK